MVDLSRRIVFCAVPCRLSVSSRGAFGCGLSALFIWAGLLASGGLEMRAQPSASKEYQLKAAFLYNFAQFVQWPEAAFPEASTPISIGVLGDDPFGVALDRVVQGESINNRKLIIKRSRQLDDLQSCHLLFISKSEKGRLAQILASLEARSILTVGETEQFAKRGGVINFFFDENRIRFEINTDAARRKGLKISSQLLSLGRIVGAETGPKNE